MARVFLMNGITHISDSNIIAVALTVSTSVLGCVMWGTVTGSMLPFVLKKLRLDPATASAPFVATLVDVTGIVIYFTMASLFLSGTVF